MVASIPPALLTRLPGVRLFEIPPLVGTASPPLAVVDGSLGGPSLWAEMVFKRTQQAGRSCLLASYHRRRLLLDRQALAEPEPWNKFTFIHVVRALVRSIHPARLLVVGREVGAKMFDLLEQVPGVVVETGFAERDITDAPVPEPVLARALDELLFRTDVFPWDSLAHALGSAQCLRSASRNIVWSATTHAELSRRFPEARITFLPPSINLAQFPRQPVTMGSTLRILLGAGAHTSGPHAASFLSIRTLLEAARRTGRCRVKILTTDPGTLAKTLDGDTESVELTSRVEHEQMPTLLARHDVYYRVQNDASLPLSCVEAMASGSVVVLNEAVMATYPALVPFENFVPVPFRSVDVLADVLRRLRDEPDLRARIGEAASHLAHRYCGLDSFLEEICWFEPS